jgi:hypothetical protein
MSEQPESTNTLASEKQQTSATVQPEKSVSGKPPMYRGILMFVIFSTLIAVLWLLTSRNIGRFFPIGTSPTPLPQEGIATPTPDLPPSPLATESAYMTLAGSVASLSADLRASVVSDPTLNPPAIELPLGFTLK